MVFPSLDVIEHWSTQASSARTWTLSVLLVALTGLLWSLVRRSLRAKLGVAATIESGNGKPSTKIACPPELLKDDLSLHKNGHAVVNGFALDREMSVPFYVGDVRVSKILVHPIKVGIRLVAIAYLRRDILTVDRALAELSWNVRAGFAIYPGRS